MVGMTDQPRTVTVDETVLNSLSDPEVMDIVDGMQKELLRRLHDNEEYLDPADVANVYSRLEDVMVGRLRTEQGVDKDEDVVVEGKDFRWVLREMIRDSGPFQVTPEMHPEILDGSHASLSFISRMRI